MRATDKASLELHFGIFTRALNAYIVRTRQLKKASVRLFLASRHNLLAAKRISQRAEQLACEIV